MSTENTRNSDQSDGLFSGIVTVISNTRQTANQEFSRFWEKFSKPVVPPTSTPNSTLHKSDIARMKAGKNIYGRIIPDNNRRGLIKDAEIQTDDYMEQETSLKRKANLISKDILSRPAKKRANNLTPSAPTNGVTTTATSPIRNQEEPKTPTYTPTDNSAPSTPTKRLFSIPSTPLRQSPDRNDIKTGSAKSVKRLTFELEEQFSPRFPSPFGSPVRKTTVASKVPDDPFHSTPLIKNNAPITDTHLTKNKSELKRLTHQEEDERMDQLEKKVGSIQSQMSEFTSYTRNDSLSPTPAYSIIADNNRNEEIFKLIANNISSPIKHIPSQYKQLSPIMTSAHTSSPAPPPAPPLPTKETSVAIANQLSSPTRNRLMKAATSPTIPKPTDKHKTKMRELIQLIPGVKLRKTDKIPGPDGSYIPNPFWNEIYNPGGRNRVF